MNKFIQHIPNYVDYRGATNEAIEFETLDDLLSLAVIKPYKESPRFSHFALSGNNLMEISYEGFKWWVVGQVLQPELLELPKWDGGKYKARFPDGTTKVLTKEVYSSCAGKLKLSNGDVVENMMY